MFWLPASMATPVQIAQPKVETELDVLKVFVDALRVNDYARAKTLVVEEAWAKLDEWIDIHEAVECRSGWKPSVETTSSSSSVTVFSGNATLLGRCITPTGDELSYGFSIHMIYMEKKTSNWKIIEWDEITEIR